MIAQVELEAVQRICGAQVPGVVVVFAGDEQRAVRVFDRLVAEGARKDEGVVDFEFAVDLEIDGFAGVAVILGRPIDRGAGGE